MQSTDYLQLTVAALYQLRDSLVTAQGNLEIAQLQTGQAARSRLHQSAQALAKANSLLTALEAYRVQMKSDATLSSVRLEQYFHSLQVDVPHDRSISYSLSRTYRLPSINTNPQLLEHIFLLVRDYLLDLGCAVVQINPKVQSHHVIIHFTPQNCRQTISYKLINRKALRTSDISSLDYATLLLVTARLLAEKVGAQFSISPTRITIGLPRARQLSLKMANT